MSVHLHCMLMQLPIYTLYLVFCWVACTFFLFNVQKIFIYIGYYIFSCYRWCKYLSDVVDWLLKSPSQLLSPSYFSYYKGLTRQRFAFSAFSAIGNGHVSQFEPMWLRSNKLKKSKLGSQDNLGPWGSCWAASFPSGLSICKSFVG